MEKTIKKIEEKLQEIDISLYRKLKHNMENWNEGETIEEYLFEALSVYRKHNAGSLSFTATNMRQAGHNYPFAVLEAVEDGVHETDIH